MTEVTEVMTEVMTVLPTVNVLGLPEFFDYKDTGCKVYHACLSCPLAECIYEKDTRTDKYTAINRQRIRELRAEGWTVSAIAKEVGLSTRAVFRHLSAIKRGTESDGVNT